jgi:hypothetical protein
VTTFAAIRTHRWGPEEEELLAALAPVFGDRLAVVYHNRPKGFAPGLPVIDIDDAWLEAQGLRYVSDWGWRCGDYALFALRASRPDNDHYLLVEPDVLFCGDVSGFFDELSRLSEDGLAVRIRPPEDKHPFLTGITDRPLMQGIFPLTRFSGHALDYLKQERCAYGRSGVGHRRYANDELFMFSWLASAEGFKVGSMEDLLPRWFEGSYFRTNPDILRDAALDPSRSRDGIYHPVRSRPSFCRETGRRIVNTTRFRKMLEPSLGHLLDDDAVLIADSIRQELTMLFAATRANRTSVK